jgi:enoyl-CoA hydratase/carnithine racemase
MSAALSKRLLWASWQMDPAAVERAETEAHLAIMGTPDAREGVMAFLERRDPVWSGSVSRDWPAPTF